MTYFENCRQNRGVSDKLSCYGKLVGLPYIEKFGYEVAEIDGILDELCGECPYFCVDLSEKE